jgi:predicted Zn-dependent peptidase
MLNTLPSGLRIAVDEMKDVETVSVGVFVNTGSRHETPEINGISHFLEHMAFKGTKKRSAKQIAEEFEGIGGRINAYPSRDLFCRRPNPQFHIGLQECCFLLEFCSRRGRSLCEP